MKNPSRLVSATLFVLILFCISGKGQAQAVFQVSDAQGTINKIGQTELTGPLEFTVVSGTTLAGRFEVTYPVPITNDTASGITIAGTGGLGGATVSVVPAARLIIINVPAGAGPGAKIIVTGVRIAAAGSTFTKLNATVSGAVGNFVTVGQTNPLIVDNVLPGMTVTTASPTFTVVAGLIVDLPGAFTLVENYVDSFTSSVGFLGQTTPVQIIFQVVGLPDNVALTFPAVSTSGATSATLTTLSGLPETLTNQSTTNRVVYQFAQSATSQTIRDDFTILPTISFTGFPDVGTAFIQVAMGPIGAAVPNAAFPSTAIPRFASDFEPVFETPTPAGTTLVLPIPTSDVSPTVIVSNAGTGTAGLTFSGLRNDGTTTVSALSPILNARETAVLTLSQLFGAGTTTATVTAVEVKSMNTKLTGSLLGVSPTGKTLTAATPALTNLTIPLNLVSPTREAIVTVTNSGDTDSSVNLTLRSATGQTIGTASLGIVAHRSFRGALLSLFGVSVASVPVDCYIIGTASQPVRATVLANPQQLVEEVPAFTRSGLPDNFYPFFVSGGGYNTVLTLVNAGNVSARITMSLVRTDGFLFPGTAPVVRVIPPLNRIDLNFQSIFGSSPSFITGSILLVTEKEGNTNPFVPNPELAGILRTSTIATSTAAPFFLGNKTEAFLAPGQETASTYTGLAVFNHSYTNATVTVEIFNPAGTLLGTNVSVLSPQSVSARLLRELAGASLGLDNTLVRVRSTAPMKILAFRGGFNLADLLYVDGQ